MFPLFGYNAAMNIHVHSFLCKYLFSILLGVYLGVELLSHMQLYVSLFEELSNCFPQWLYHFTLPPGRYESSNFSTTPPILIIVCHFDYSHPSGYEEVSHYVFFFFFLAAPHGMWDLSSPTTDGTHTSPQWKHGVLTTGPLSKSLIMTFFSFYFILLFKKHLYWSIVDVQCCVSFRCTAK